MERPAYLSARELKERGWTERLIRIYLPQPDKTVPNPYRAAGAPKRLYAATKVAQIERDLAEFQTDREKSDRYSTRLQVQSNARKSMLDELVRSIELPPLTLTWDEVMAAVQKQRLNDPALAAQPESELALQLLLDTVKSLDWHLDEYMYHSGIREARKLHRRRMLAHIIDRYPVLAEPARRRAASEDGNTDSW